MDEITNEAIEQEIIEVQIIQSKCTEEIFSEESALYVEILDDNYHHADIIGISLSNEQGIFISMERVLCNRRLLKNGQKMRQTENRV